MNVRTLLSISLATAAVVAGPTGLAEATSHSATQDAQAYRTKLKPGIKTLTSAAAAVEKAVDRASDRSNKQVASDFAKLTPRLNKAADQIDSVEAPSAFRTRQATLVKAIRASAQDTKKIVAAAKANSASRAKSAATALARDLKTVAAQLKKLNKELSAN